MIKAYFNCPDSLVTIHQNPNCAQAKVGPEAVTRHVLLNHDSIGRELRRFRDGKHPLAATGDLDDLWLLLDFQDMAFEKALVLHVKRLAGEHCAPIAKAEATIHCE